MNITPLRLAMLAKIEAGDVARGLGVTGWWFGGELPSGYGHCCRAVSELIRTGLARIPPGADYRTPVDLTDAGRQLLKQKAGTA